MAAKAHAARSTAQRRSADKQPQAARRTSRPLRLAGGAVDREPAPLGLAARARASAEGQRAFGLRATAPKVAPIKVAPANDPAEKEADDVAQRVVSGGQVAPTAAEQPAAQREEEPAALREQQPMAARNEPAAQREEQVDAKGAEQVAAARGDRPEPPVEAPVQTLAGDGALHRQDDGAEPMPEADDSEIADAEAADLRDDDVENAPEVQAKLGPEGGEVDDPGVAARIRSPGPGRPLSGDLRSKLEPRFGVDFSRVRVHDAPQDRADAKAIGARAFTFGTDIWLGPGESEHDERLMAHELTHVVQQGGASPRRRSEEAAAHREAGDEAARTTSAEPKRVHRISWAGLLEKASEWAQDIPGYRLVAFAIKRDPITGKPVPRNATTLIGAIMSLVPGGNRLFLAIKESGAIPRLVEWFQTQFRQLGITWAHIKSLFKKAWDAISGWDLLLPWRAWKKAKRIFMPTINRVLAFIKAVGRKVLEVIFEVALTNAGPFGKRVLEFVRKAGKALWLIISNPVGFLKNLLGSVFQGFKQFGKNIWKHLKAGIMGWLFGTLAKAGVQMPEKFDFKGILSLVLQILGITYDRVRAKLVEHIGEKRVAYIEKAVAFVRILVTEGIAGVWRKLLEYVGNLKDMVLGAIKSWLVTKIVTLAISKIVMLFNPIGALVQAIITIYNVIKWLIERIDQIIAVVTAIANSIIDIAMGKLKAAANYVEQTLAKFLPVIISFLASFLGLGGIVDRIRGIIKKLQAKVDKAIGKVVGFIVKKAKALFAKVGGAVKKGVGKLTAWWKARAGFKQGSEEHTMYFEGSGKNARVMVRSTPMLLATYVAGIEKQDKEAGSPNKTTIQAIRRKLKKIDDLRSTGSGADRRDTSGQKGNAEKIAKLFQEIADLMGKLPGGAKDKARPATNAKWETEGEDGRLMVARPLSIVAGSFTGSSPSEGSRLWHKVNQRENAYVRAHLLNHHLHGPGVKKNLAPLPSADNTRMETSFENLVKEAVLDRNEVVQYEVEMVYGDHGKRTHIPEEANVPTLVKMSYQPMKLKSAAANSPEEAKKPDSWMLSSRKKKTKEITVKLPPDTPIGLQLVKLNLADVGCNKPRVSRANGKPMARERLARVPGVGATVADLILAQPIRSYTHLLEIVAGPGRDGAAIETAIRAEPDIVINTQGRSTYKL